MRGVVEGAVDTLVGGQGAKALKNLFSVGGSKEQ
jgi:hypothetical protein